MRAPQTYLLAPVLALAAFALLGATGAFTQSASNVTLVGTYDTPGSAGRVHLATAASATYAYVADGQRGTRILDVTDRAAPRDVGSLPSPNSCPATGAHPDCGPAFVTSFAASGSVLFRTDSKLQFCSTRGCVDNPESGLRTFDISDPTSPTELGFLRTGTPEQVVVYGSHAYLADGLGGFRVVDVSDPSRPTEVFAETGRVRYGVAVAGGYAYVATGGDATLLVYDVRDPTRPVRVGAGISARPGSPDSARGGFAVALVGRYALVAGTWENGAGRLFVFDVSDPTRPTEVGGAVTPETALDVAVAGGYAYVAAWGSGLRVFSIADPTAPVEVGYYDTPGTAKAVSLSGGDVFVGDEAAGVQILRFSGASTVGPFRARLPAVLKSSGWS